jgi:hypothetical protein
VPPQDILLFDAGCLNNCTKHIFKAKAALQTTKGSPLLDVSSL